MGKYARRVDENHKEIMDTYRLCGATVKDVSRLPGFCDLVVGYCDMNFLIEVKDGKKTQSRQKLTNAEAKFHADWNGQITIIRSSDEAMDHVRDIRELAKARRIIGDR